MATPYKNITPTIIPYASEINVIVDMNKKKEVDLGDEICQKFINGEKVKLKPPIIDKYHDKISEGIEKSKHLYVQDYNDGHGCWVDEPGYYMFKPCNNKKIEERLSRIISNMKTPNLKIRMYYPYHSNYYQIYNAMIMKYCKTLLIPLSYNVSFCVEKNYPYCKIIADQKNKNFDIYIADQKMISEF